MHGRAVAMPLAAELTKTRRSGSSVTLERYFSEKNWKPTDNSASMKRGCRWEHHKAGATGELGLSADPKPWLEPAATLTSRRNTRESIHQGTKFL